MGIKGVGMWLEWVYCWVFDLNEELKYKCGYKKSLTVCCVCLRVVIQKDEKKAKSMWDVKERCEQFDEHGLICFCF